MGNYSKFIVAAVGFAIMIVNQVWGVDLTGYSDGVIAGINAAIGIATALGVKQIANKPL